MKRTFSNLSSNQDWKINWKMCASPIILHIRLSTKVISRMTPVPRKNALEKTFSNLFFKSGLENTLETVCFIDETSYSPKY